MIMIPHVTTKDNSTIAEIKARLTVEEAIYKYLPEVRLQRKAARLWALCPFHNEKTPSFCVSLDTNRWRCFGCQVGGDVIDLVALALRIPLREAIKLLAKELGISRGEYSPAQRRKIAREIQERQEQQRLEKDLTALVANAYSYLIGLEKWTYYILKHMTWEGDLDRPAVIWALQRKSFIEFLLDTLIDGDPQDKLRAAAAAEEVGLLK